MLLFKFTEFNVQCLNYDFFSVLIQLHEKAIPQNTSSLPKSKFVYFLATVCGQHSFFVLTNSITGYHINVVLMLYYLSEFVDTAIIQSLSTKLHMVIIILGKYIMILVILHQYSFLKDHRLLPVVEPYRTEGSVSRFTHARLDGLPKVTHFSGHTIELGPRSLSCCPLCLPLQWIIEA